MPTVSRDTTVAGKRRTLLACTFALLAALGFCLWLGCQDIPQQLQRLPDGETIRLLGVTHDRKPELMTGPPLLKLLAPVIPINDRQAFGLAAWSHDSQPFTVWLSFGDGFGFESPAAKVNGVLRAWDEKGNCSAMRLGSLLHMDDYPVYPLSLDHFPRRGKELRLELFGDDGKGHIDHLARFKVANPLYRDYAEWKASPLPDRQHERGIVATMEKLQTGLPGTPSALHGRKLLESGLPVWTEAVLSLRESGRFTNDWKFRSVRFEDATGNEISPEYTLERLGKGRVKLRFAGHLWEEPAWRVAVEMHRVRNPRPQHLLQFRVRIPESGEGRSVTYLSRRKSPLRVFSVFGPNLSEEQSALAALIDTRKAGVIAELSGGLEETTVDLVSIQSGRRRRQVFIEGSVFDDENLWYPLGDARAGNATLTFAIRDKRKFTFQVRPTIH